MDVIARSRRPARDTIRAHSLFDFSDGRSQLLSHNAAMTMMHFDKPFEQLRRYDDVIRYYRVDEVIAQQYIIDLWRYRYAASRYRRPRHDDSSRQHAPAQLQYRAFFGLL